MNSLCSRRMFLQLGASAALAFRLPTLSAAETQQRGSERPRSLITVWLEGGPSQLETWDPHPGTSIGGPTRGIKTGIPDVQIAHLFPRTAEQLQHMSLIRSLVSKEGDHARASYYLKTGYRPDPTLTHPSLGAVAAHAIEAPPIEIPRHVSLGASNLPARGGYLGAELDAFKVFDPGRNLRNLEARVDDPRQQRRLRGLEIIGRAFARNRSDRVEQTRHHQTIDRALTMMNSTQLRAFELAGESQQTLDRYGDTSFGRGCLVARRLIEQGVRAVEVTLRGFDTHADNFTGHETQAEILDPALSSLISDLAERDLLQSTVVLCLGEFGREPTINNLEGRDHWPDGFSCLLGGGGLREGVVIGQTDPTGENDNPADPVLIRDLFATVMAGLGIAPETKLYTPIGRPMAFSNGTPIRRLLRSNTP